MKRTLVSLIAAALTLGLAAPSSAAIRITKIYFDSPGADTGSNKSLNAEYVVIKNTGTIRKTLTGWTLRDASRHVYKFPTFRLGAGKSVKVHTGKGINYLGNLYWRSSSYIWNNNGDTATLKRSNGTVASRCSYTGAGSYKIC
jgi:Lamin Tail Domain